MRSVWWGLFGLGLAGVGGCGVDDGRGSGDPSPADAEVVFADYVDALVAGDVDAVEDIVSSEVVARGEQRGLTMDQFADKQLRAMNRTFGLDDGEVPQFAVTALTDEGGAYRGELALDGAALDKPVYFVEEDGELRVSLLAPGFADEAPDGAAFARSNYLIRNDQIPGNQPTTMYCNGGVRTVNPTSSGSVSCIDSCGWWSGTIFQRANDPIVRYCDWNAWGADVIIDIYLLGWDCNDYC